MCGFPSRLNRIRSSALASVAVPTVERGSAPIRCWSTMIAVVSPSRTSTSGRASVGMKPCTKALYVSLISRCDSAAIVSNTSELLPEPDTPVNTVSRRFGSSMLTSFRLFSRAPCTRIRSWLSEACRTGDFVFVVVALLIVSAQLLDADHVAGGIPKGTVANPVWLFGGLLDHLDVAHLQPLESAVEVLGGQKERAVGALGHHLGDDAALVVGKAGGGGRRVQNDGRVGLVRRADRDPAHLVSSDVEAHLEAEGVAIESQGGVRVIVREETRVNGDVHGAHAMCGLVIRASRFLIGLVTCFDTHGGIPAVASTAWRREVLGGIPTSSVKRVLKVPSDAQPTAKQTSVTLRSPPRSSAIARSMRRVIR